MKKRVVIGLDTSNYTTSLAIVTLEGDLVANLKRPLLVKTGERGLRQSDALFAHTVNIPDLMNEAKDYLENCKILAVGVSDRPRNQEGSYMPCFLAGVSAAKSISVALGVPLYTFSHQCGHIMAAVYSSGENGLLNKEFGAIHISGGTTELVKITPDNLSFKSELIGGTADLNAGQIIDRIGVYMGLKFPAGPALEALALENTKTIPSKKISAVGTTINLSGLENLAVKLYNDTMDKSLTAAFVFDYLGRAISAMIGSYYENFGSQKIVCAGGVMCNSIIKKMLSNEYDVCFAEPPMSADNAVGIAVLALRTYKTENICD